MSHDISLNCPCCKQVLHMPESFEDGGTHVYGGDDECRLNVTYNYGSLYRDVFPEKDITNGPISWLYGKTGGDTITVLRKGVERLGTKRDDNYWNATAGNAGAALERLLSFTLQHPAGVWDGD
jgi:hypothetical protein